MFSARKGFGIFISIHVAVKNIFERARTSHWELSDEDFKIISSYQKKLNDSDLKNQVISHFKDICDALIDSYETGRQAKYMQLFSQIIELFPQALKGKAQEFYPERTHNLLASPAACA
jgi:hypothetical protein